MNDKKTIEACINDYSVYIAKVDKPIREHLNTFLNGVGVDCELFRKTILMLADQRAQFKRDNGGRTMSALTMRDIESAYYNKKKRDQREARSFSRMDDEHCHTCSGTGVKYGIVFMNGGRLNILDHNKPVSSAQYWTSGVPCKCTRGDWCNDNLDFNDKPYSQEQRAWIARNSFTFEFEASNMIDKITGWKPPKDIRKKPLPIPENRELVSFSNEKKVDFRKREEF